MLPAPLRLRFAVISTCQEAWGGSEELWYRASLNLAKEGHKVSIFKTVLDKKHAAIQALSDASCKVHHLFKLPLPHSIVVLSRLSRLTAHLKIGRSDLVVISQGDNYDGLRYAQLCGKLKIPYTLISQKATDYFWPPDRSRQYWRDGYSRAAHCFFVSEHNRRITEDQIGCDLTNASVVRNPFLVPYDVSLPWPAREDAGLRLACVGRLYLLDKGQDILLRVLAKPKWKERALHVSFFGSGVNREGLALLARKLGVSHVNFAGQTENILKVWADNHMLILPSRGEGLPLALVEAMLCGRPAIVSTVGGNAEVVEDNVTGFLTAPTVDALDQTLEVVWNRRHELHEMGERAARSIRRLVPSNPAGDFASLLQNLALKQKDGSRHNDDVSPDELKSFQHNVTQLTENSH